MHEHNSLFFFIQLVLTAYTHILHMYNKKVASGTAIQYSMNCINTYTRVQYFHKTEKGKIYRLLAPLRTNHLLQISTWSPYRKNYIYPVEHTDHITPYNTTQNHVLHIATKTEGSSF